MRDHPVWLVAQREIREAVRRTAFKVTLLVTMAAIAAAVVVPAILEKSASDDAARFAALAANILLFVFLQIYGTWILMGVIEEKQSRVIEVLISAVRPRQLLVGKVVGVGATALMHGSLCVLTAVVAGLLSGSTLMSRVGVSTVLIAGLWLLVGYAFYCTVYAAAGSLCSRAEDARGVSFPLMLPVFIAYFAGFSALGCGEDNAFLAVLSFLPPTAPLAMPVRYGIGAAPAWQVMVAVIFTLAGAVAVGRLAGASMRARYYIRASGCA